MATTVSQTTALPEGERFYLLRGNTMVPLVPVDQLPFQLRGLPRHLSHRQMSDENWKLLQETKHAALSFAIRVPANIAAAPPSASPTRTSHSRFLAPDHYVRSSSKDIQDEVSQGNRWSAPANMNQNLPSAPYGSSTAAQKTPVSISDTFVSIYSNDAQPFGYHTPYPSGIEPDQSKKEFCTHWIQTGECAFTSVGCKYKHEMPTMDKLRQLGFTQMLKWWKEKSAITARGPTWMQLRLASSTKDCNELGETPPPRASPDPSTFRNRQGISRDLPRDTPLSRRVPQKLGNEVTTRSPKTALSRAEASMRRDSQVSNFLIDFEETSASPSSPQPSSCSSSITETFDAPNHSDSTFKSSPPASLFDEAVVTTTNSNLRVKEPRSKHKNKPHPIIRRESLRSHNSDVADDCTAVKPISKTASLPRKNCDRADASTKQAGLANSRHPSMNRDLSKVAGACTEDVARKLPQSTRNKMGSEQKHSHGTPDRRIARGRASRRTSSAIEPLIDHAKRLIG